jgi:uncharacterized protein DUF3710
MPLRRTRPDTVPAARPRTLIGAYLVAMIYSDHADPDRVLPRFAARFPYGAADQEIVGDLVFAGLARELFASYPSVSPLIDEFAAGALDALRAGPTVRAPDLAALIRGALAGQQPQLRVGAVDLMKLHLGFTIAAIRQLGLTRDRVELLIADAERQAAERGVWLVPSGDFAPEPTSEPRAEPDAEAGPWDLAQVAQARCGRLDFGSLLLRAPRGTDVRLLQDGGQAVAVEIHLARTVLHLNAFAAGPGGHWDAVRRELTAQVVRHSGTVREIAGLGIELWAQLAGEARSIRHLRFIGKDGPGWLCRGVFLWGGKPAADEFAILEGVVRDLVVVRGAERLAGRTRLPLTAPT